MISEQKNDKQSVCANIAKLIVSSRAVGKPLPVVCVAGYTTVEKTYSIGDIRYHSWGQWLDHKFWKVAEEKDIFNYLMR